jgi:hypothetical protein
MPPTREFPESDTRRLAVGLSGIQEKYRMSEALTGAELKKQLREGKPKMGLFLNSHSPTVAEQLAHSGYERLGVDT